MTLAPTHGPLPISSQPEPGKIAMPKRLRGEAKNAPALYTGKHDDGRHSSRIANGKRMLPIEDGRSVWARLQKSTYRALLAHLGGDDRVTDVQRIVCRRCATIEAELVHLEDRLAKLRRSRKEPPHSLLQSYASLTAQQLRLTKQIGIDRQSMPLNDEPKDLQAYLASKNGHRRNGRSHGMTIEHEEVD
jgi:hypothetical protein